MKIRSWLPAATLVIFASGLHAMPRPSEVAASPGPKYVYSPFTTVRISSFEPQYLKDLNALRDEGLALQQADGGTLTPAHRAQLQDKLDGLRASYRSRIARSDPWAIVSWDRE